MIGRYKEFEIYEAVDSSSRFRRSYYWVWNLAGYLTIRGEIKKSLRNFGDGDTGIFCFFDICDIENALSIYLGDPIKLDIIITRKELV